MLVLGRHQGQRIIINDDLFVTVTSVDLITGFVKLGFDGCKFKYTVDRYEVYMRKLRGEP